MLGKRQENLSGIRNSTGKSQRMTDVKRERGRFRLPRLQSFGTEDLPTFEGKPRQQRKALLPTTSQHSTEGQGHEHRFPQMFGHSVRVQHR